MTAVTVVRVVVRLCSPGKRGRRNLVLLCLWSLAGHVHNGKRNGQFLETGQERVQRVEF